MVKFATQYEVDNFKDFEFRLLTPLDALEFSKAQNESLSRLSDYFDPDILPRPNSFIDSFSSLLATIRSQELDLFGMFKGERLLGVGSYHFLEYSNHGCQIVIWVRSSEMGKRIGSYFLKRLTLHAIYNKKFRFVELLIDKSNSASRAIATKVGYEHIHNYEGKTEGKLASGVYCRYICFDAEIEALAEEFQRRKIDLIDHPAYIKELRNLDKQTRNLL
jgi:RimJ/RimL family protein N-acetyltransferase